MCIHAYMHACMHTCLHAYMHTLNTGTFGNELFGKNMEKPTGKYMTSFSRLSWIIKKR